MMDVDLDALSAQLHSELKGASGQKKARIVKRLEVVDAFRISGTWDCLCLSLAVGCSKRIMQQDHIISGKKPIVVDFEGDYNCTLPCIKMADVSDNVSCYLCIIPGMVLSQVYHKYHQLLVY